MAGITAAVELAETGKELVLLEKEARLGGKVSRFHNYFPKLCPPSCGLEINFRRIRSSSRIQVHTHAEVMRIAGRKGDFTLQVRYHPRLINSLCTSCGLCAAHCPEGAVLVPGGLAFPMLYDIDPERCLGEDCAKCLEVCAYDAIELNAPPRMIEMKAEELILATGWELYHPGKVEAYAYNREADVITNLEMEELLASCTRDGSPFQRPSDGKKPTKVAFVQCAGSRDENHLSYCSAVCCSASIKHALTLSELSPDISSEIFYIDLRLSGRNEKLLQKAEAHPQVILTKGKVGRIHRGEEGPVLEVEDIMAGGKRMADFDLVVLAMGMVPRVVDGDVDLNREGFYLAQQENGLIVAGSCKRPMDVSSSVKDATAAALKSMQS